MLQSTLLDWRRMSVQLKRLYFSCHSIVHEVSIFCLSVTIRISQTIIDKNLISLSQVTNQLIKNIVTSHLYFVTCILSSFHLPLYSKIKPTWAIHCSYFAILVTIQHLLGFRMHNYFVMEEKKRP